MSGQRLHHLDGVIADEAELAQPGSTRCSFQLQGTGDEVTFLLLKQTDSSCESLSLLRGLAFSAAGHQDLLSGKQALISWVFTQEGFIFRASLGKGGVRSRDSGLGEGASGFPGIWYHLGGPAGPGLDEEHPTQLGAKVAGAHRGQGALIRAWFRCLC